MLQISFASFPHGDLSIPGLCVVGRSKQEGLEIAHLTERHFEIPGLKDAISVSVRSSDKDGVNIQISFDSRVGSIEILNVDDALMGDFTAAFRRIGKFFIMAAYGSEDLEVIPSSQFNLVLENLYVDGEKVLAANSIKIDWKTVLRSIF